MADYPTSCTDKSAGIQAPNKQVRKILALIAASRPDALVNWGSCGENASSRQLEKREKKALRIFKLHGELRITLRLISHRTTYRTYRGVLSFAYWTCVYKH